jgi:hypothetical protein
MMNQFGDYGKIDALELAKLVRDRKRFRTRAIGGGKGPSGEVTIKKLDNRIPFLKLSKARDAYPIKLET